MLLRRRAAVCCMIYICMIGGHTRAITWPVSYTHLDVYKRQILFVCPWPWSHKGWCACNRTEHCTHRWIRGCFWGYVFLKNSIFLQKTFTFIPYTKDNPIRDIKLFASFFFINSSLSLIHICWDFSRAVEWHRHPCGIFRGRNWPDYGDQCPDRRV